MWVREDDDTTMRPGGEVGYKPNVLTGGPSSDDLAGHYQDRMQSGMDHSTAVGETGSKFGVAPAHVERAVKASGLDPEHSVVDLMKSKGVSDSGTSLSARRELARQHGYNGGADSARMNTWLHGQIKSGAIKIGEEKELSENIDTIVAASEKKEPAAIVDSFAKEMLDRTLELVNQKRLDVADQMFREDELLESIEGRDVMIKPHHGGMKEFHGKTGTVIGKEGKHYRVKLHEPVHVPGVGHVKDDLWERGHLKVLREAYRGPTRPNFALGHINIKGGKPEGAEDIGKLAVAKELHGPIRLRYRGPNPGPGRSTVGPNKGNYRSGTGYTHKADAYGASMYKDDRKKWR